MLAPPQISNREKCPSPALRRLQLEMALRIISSKGISIAEKNLLDGEGWFLTIRYVETTGFLAQCMTGSSPECK